MQKSISFHESTISRFNWIAHNFLHVTDQSIIKFIFILSSASGSLELLSVKHNSIYKKIELNVKIIKTFGEILIIHEMGYWEQMYIRPLNHNDNRCL